MNKNFYDIVVIGTELSGLVAAALLSARGFRVLIVPDEDLPYTYPALDFELPRYPYTFLGTDSPAVKRVFAELSLSQTFRRKALLVDPVLQIVTRTHRVDFPSEESVLFDELSREHGVTKRDIANQHRDLVHISDAFFELLGRDISWPPERFLERREWNRIHKMLPKEEAVRSYIEHLIESPLWKTTLSVMKRFSVPAVEQHAKSPWSIARTYAKWTRGSATFIGGYQDIQELFIQKIESLGGTFMQNAKVERLIHHKDAITAVSLNHDETPIQCHKVLAAMPVARLVHRFADAVDWSGHLDAIQAPVPSAFHYTLNIVMRQEGVPLGISRDIFALRDEKRPYINDNAIRLQVHRPDAQGRQIICIEALIPAEHGLVRAATLSSLRENILDAVREVIPFLDQHLLLVDSPHDGREVYDALAREHVSPTRPWLRGPHTMPATFAYSHLTHLNLCAWPPRTPLKGLFFAGNQSIPTLGDEGAFLSGWSLARMISQSDKRRAKLREGLWHGTEI